MGLGCLLSVAFSVDSQVPVLRVVVNPSVESKNISAEQIRRIFSIDDFGTGYSSLAYLKQMPVDIIKIDRSFVAGMNDNSADMQIVSSIIVMVQKLGMQVVAEGFETSSQMKLLADLNFEIGQGYFISRPIPESELYDLLPEKLQFGVWDKLNKLKTKT